jgi:hypothetical protein
MEKKNSHIPKGRISFLEKNEIPNDFIKKLFIGAGIYQELGGIKSEDYWTTEEFDIRDEYFVVFISYISMFNDLRKEIPYQNEWRLKFDVAFLYQVKSNSQSCKSLDMLLRNHCYADAFVICRTMISRLNLLLLCSLNPALFDEWLKNLKHEKFLDSHIRKELKNNGLSIATHLYEQASEVVHGHNQAMTEMGYFKKGYFPVASTVKDKIYIIAKFVIATSYITMIKMSELDFGKSIFPQALQKHRKMFNWLEPSYLAPNRVDQLFSLLPEDRFWKEVGKNKYKASLSYDYSEIQDQLEKFHRKGQKKKLSKKYR